MMPGTHWSASRCDDGARQREEAVVRTLEFRLTADEAVQIYREAVMRWVDYVFIVVLLVGPGIVGFYPLADGIAGMLATGLLVLPLVAWLAWPFWRMRQIRRANAKNPAPAEVFEFDNGCVTVYAANDTKSHHDITRYRVAAINKRFLYLYCAQAHFRVIPRRAFKDDDFNRLLRMLRANGVQVGPWHYRSRIRNLGR